MMRVILLAVVLTVPVSLLAQGSQTFTDVPYVATPDNLVDAMLDLASVHPNDVLVDLGSGDGRIPIEAAKRFGVRAIGVEIDPELIRQSQDLARQQGVSNKVTFIAADLFQFDLHDATVVTMFLTPGVNIRLRPKLLKELKPGSRIVTHRFDMGNWAPAKTLAFGEDHIYLWIVPATKPDFSLHATAALAPAEQQLDAMVTYDASVPLNFHAETESSGPGPIVARVSFSGGRGPVSGTLIRPLAPGKHPAIIFAHDYGKKDEFLSEALLLAQAKPPVASLLVDAPVERPLGWRRNFNSLSDSDNDRDIHAQAIVDIRRAIDLLSARDDVDASRIAFVGHGYGANWGAILGSVDARVRAFVLIAGFPSFGDLIDRDDPDWANVAYAMGTERFARYKASLSTVDPILFTRYWKQAPVLLQFGRFDEFVTRAMAEQLAASLPPSHKTIFYDAGHSVNAPTALTDRDEFLLRNLK